MSTSETDIQPIEAAPRPERRLNVFATNPRLTYLFILVLFTLEAPFYLLFHAPGDLNDDSGDIVARISYPLVLLLLLAIVFTHRNGRQSPPVPWLALPFIIYTAASGFWSLSLYLTIREVGMLVALVASVFLLANRFEIHRLWLPIARFYLFVLLISVFVAVFIPSIGQHALYDPSNEVHTGDWRGLYQHKNALAGFASMAFAVFLLAPLPEMSRRGYVNERTLGLLLSVLCLVFCKSANALGGAFIICIPLFVLRNRNVAWLRVLGWGAAVFAALILLLLAVLSTQGGFDWAFESAVRYKPSIISRVIIWTATWRWIGANFWIGTGYGYGVVELKDFLTQIAGSAVDPHNGILYLITQVGFIGAVLFILFIAGALIAGAVTLRTARGAERAATMTSFAILLMCCFQSLFEASTFKPHGPTGVMCFITSCLLYASAAIPAHTSHGRLPSSPPRSRTQPAKPEKAY